MVKGTAPQRVEAVCSMDYKSKLAGRPGADSTKETISITSFDKIHLHVILSTRYSSDSGKFWIITGRYRGQHVTKRL
jgi:hypothetical protein